MTHQMTTFAILAMTCAASCAGPEKATLPENPEPYHFASDRPEVGVARGFFMDAVDIQSEEGMTADQVRLFEQRELQKVWVQPGHRYVTFRLQAVDQRFEGKPPEERPHFILTESGLTGLSWNFPQNAVTQAELASLALSREESMVGKGQCPEKYPRLAVSTERLEVPNGAVVPRGTLAVVEDADGSARLRIIDEIPSVPSSNRFEFRAGGWKIVVSDFCLKDIGYATQYVDFKAHEFDRKIRKYLTKQDYTKGMRVLDRSQLQKSVGQAVQENRKNSFWTLNLNNPSSGTYREKSKTKVDSVEESVLNELLTEYAGERDETREIYVNGDNVSTLRSYYESSDQLCKGQTWIYSQKSMAASVAVDSCVLARSGARFQMNANGFELYSSKDYIKVRNELLRLTRGAADSESQTDFLMSRLSHYYSDGISRETLLALAGYSSAMRFGHKGSANVVAFPDINWTVDEINGSTQELPAKIILSPIGDFYTVDANLQKYSSQQASSKQASRVH